MVRARLRTPIRKFEKADLLESRLLLNSQIWEFSFPESLILARAERPGQLFILNQTAAFLWSLYREGLSPSALQTRFCEEYGLPPDQAEADISATLSAWHQELLSPTLPTKEIRLSPPDCWSASAQYLVNGRRVRVSVGDPQLAAEISPRLESLHAAHPSEPDIHLRVWRQDGEILLAHDNELISSEENPNAVRAILLQEMVRRTETGREWLAVLHAGACGGDDSCILLAGASQSGKTTLCAALLANGFTFYCDDSAAIARHDGTISPMPFHMMVRQGSWNVLQSRYPEIASCAIHERFGERVRFLAPWPGRMAQAPGAPNALLFVSYVPCEKTALRRLLPFETLLKLQESGFWVQHDRHSIAAFLEWLQSLPVFEFTYSDLDDAISKLRKLSEQGLPGVAP